MSCILRIQETDAADVSDAAAVEAVSAKGYAWTARIVSNVPVFVLIATGVDADDEDLYLNEFEDQLFAVSADQDVSVLGTDVGTVWVSEVRKSS